MTRCQKRQAEKFSVSFCAANKIAGKDLTGQSFLTAMEDGKAFVDLFNSPPIKFSAENHLGSTVTQVHQIKNGRWVVMKDGLMF